MLDVLLNWPRHFTGAFYLLQTKKRPPSGRPLSCVSSCPPYPLAGHQILSAFPRVQRPITLGAVLNYLDCCKAATTRPHRDSARRKRLANPRACPLWSRTVKHAGCSSTDHGGRKAARHSIARLVDAIGCSMAVWLRFFESKTVTCGFGYLFFISFAASSAASYVPNPDFSCRSTAT